MKSLSQVAVRYLMEQKKRSILTIIGIVISVAMITSIGTMIYSVDQLELRNVREFSGTNHGSYSNITLNQYNYVKNNVNTEVMGKSILAGTTAIESRSRSYRIEISGYDNNYIEMRNINPVEGRLPEKPNEIALERWKAEEIGLKIGEEITFTIGHYMIGENILRRNEWSDEAIFHEVTVHTFTLVGVIDSRWTSLSSRVSTAIVDLNWAEEINTTSEVTAVLRVKTRSDITETLREIATAAGISERDIEYNNNLIRREQGYIPPELVIIALFLIGLICVATIAVIFNSFNISVLERIKQFGVMRSIGTTPSQIRTLVFTEASIMSAISIPLGLGVGYYGTVLLFMLLSGGEFSNFQNIIIVTSPVVIGGSIVISLIAVYLSAFVPALSAGRVTPLDAIFQHRSLKKERETRKGFLWGKIFGAEGLLAYKNSRRNKKRLIVTAFSMSISVIMFLVFSVFTNYAFKINDRSFAFNADFTLYGYGAGTYSEEDLANILAMEGLSKVTPLRTNMGNVLVDTNRILENLKKYDSFIAETGLLYNSYIQGYDHNQMAILTDKLQSGTLDIEKLNNENGVLVVQNARVYDHQEMKFVVNQTLDLKIGDIIKIKAYNRTEFNLDIKEEDYISLKVMGIIEMSPIGEQFPHYGGVGLITTKEVFEYATGRTGYDSIFVDMKEDANYNDVVAGLRSITEKYSRDAMIFDNIANTRRERQTKMEISILIYGFISLISLIGALNIINTISTNLITRVKEFGMLRAVGMSPKSMRKMIRLEAVFSSVIGTIFGLAVGNMLGYILYTLINDFQGYPWEFPLNANLIAIFATIIIALLATITPLKKVAAMNIIETLREE